MYYADHNKGTEFFTATEPEQAIVYVQARGNLSRRGGDIATFGVCLIQS